MIPEQNVKIADFEAMRLSIASPEDILKWSYGEVARAETINYRTQKPEKDGLFDERIFGPTKDWECYCGKYKKIRYKGIICDKCGVEVTRSIVRRERMGHIALATPVSHIWFLRGVPSKIGLVLDLSVQGLEKVIYFADFIITKVDEDLKQETISQLKQEFKNRKQQIESETNRQINQVKVKKGLAEEATDDEVVGLARQKEEQLKELMETFHLAEQELKELKPLRIISEHSYQELSLRYGHIFEAGIGAEAVRDLLEKVDFEKTINELETELKVATGAKREKIIRRIKLFKNLEKNKLRPEWMIMTMVPVIPPDLRPMVPLDGGRFATSDLNDLYRRVINRNNRLKQLLELNAPEVIIRNEKRMLQEAADALIDNNARQGKTVTASTGQRRMLKSLADMLKGKQGRFRQNLLGKRVDYSGRSVIIVGPSLKLDQCGLPKIMALELYRPFVISQLIKRELVHNIRSANRFIESGRIEVWDILEEVVAKSHVLLNRAPTLHRLGIQAFKPILIEGKAIQVHPLVCPAFNADFDGDQMAVHLPLTEEAQWEAANLMLATKNLLKPATGDPIVAPDKDIVWGCYYLTRLLEAEKELKVFSDWSEVLLAWQTDNLKLQEKIKVRVELDKDGRIIKYGQRKAKSVKNQLFETSAGRIIFNQVLPPEVDYLNEQVAKSHLSGILRQVLRKCGPEVTVELLDTIKSLAYKHLTMAGVSLGMSDFPDIPKVKELIKAGDQQVDEIIEQYEAGLLTQDERYTKIIGVWTEIKDQIATESKKAIDKNSSVFAMVDSNARGSWAQLVQMIGMKGLVINPAGQIIELPVKGNFKRGFDVLEFFISTHGARKGLSDTALRTSSAGYLTRRLVDVAQELIIREDDCKDEEGLIVTKAESEEMGKNLADRVSGRYTIEAIIDTKTKKTIVEAGELITEDLVKKVKEADVSEIKIRSLLTCRSLRGICKKCYGIDLAYNKLVETGTAVGVIAAQSIGEPGTQLTMRTFHTGGVAAASDITQGLPRVEEIFEVRPPKYSALVAEEGGFVSIKEGPKGSRQRLLQIEYQKLTEEVYNFGVKDEKINLQVKEGEKVAVGSVLYIRNKEKILAKKAGLIKLEEGQVKIISEGPAVSEYVISPDMILLVHEGQTVLAGDQLTEGSLDLKNLFRQKGKLATQKYIIKEIQGIYSSQGQKLNDKHIETIVRQMFSKGYIKDAGDTELLPGEIVDISEAIEENLKLPKTKGQEAVFDQLLLGITKISLATRSFLASASFQETSRVLINAAVSGKIDKLEGLKENIIIGRLIPAGTGFRKI
ncbi:MAG: DNA-directed RNA polymerase subunit beta' [Candidatus Buchananbacteria bacterium]